MKRNKYLKYIYYLRHFFICKKNTAIIAGIFIILAIFTGILFYQSYKLPENREKEIVKKDAMRTVGKPEDKGFSAADYKNGTIILVKPIATGVGEDRYEAGDIVEIRDGEEIYQKFGNGPFLGKDERTAFLPLYYPGKMTNEQKIELMSGEIVRLEQNYKNINEEIATTTEVRHKYGIDYTLLLSDWDTLKIRRQEQLNYIPEVSLSQTLNKKSGQTFDKIVVNPSAFNDNSAGDWQIKSVVQLSFFPSLLEKTINFFINIWRAVIRIAVAAPIESIKIVDPGNGPGTNYLSLNAWEAGEQKNLVSANQIAVAKCRATGGVADKVAVTINGWTTDASHYIKIWTDPAENYRHNGKWDTTKYRLEAAIDNTGALRNDAFYVRIDGLQISVAVSGCYYIYAFLNNVSQLSNPGEVRISNTIIKKTGAKTTGYHGGIWTGGENMVLKAWDNIFYDFQGGSVRSFGFHLENGTAYLYNNTFQNSQYGMIRWSNGTVIAKNNLFKSVTNPGFGVFAAGTDYNSTDNASMGYTVAGGGNTHDRIRQAFAFVDEAGDNFHIASADTGAREYGVSDPGSGLFSNDIDGQSRPYSSSWDIGADEFTVVQPAQIYRSVGPSNTNALASGAGNTLTIFDSAATFTSPLPDKVGIGDALQYDSDNNGSADKLVFIYGRTDSTHYMVKNAAGQIPPIGVVADNDWSIYRAYTSLFDAEAGTENLGIAATLRNFDTWSGGKDLVVSNEVWNIACYGDAVDTAQVEINGWTTSANNYIKIYTPYLTSEVGTSQRHNGTWNDNKYRLQITNDRGVLIYEENVRIEGLQIKLTLTNSWMYAIASKSVSSAGDIRISYNIVKGALSGISNNNYGIIWNNPVVQNVRIWNNIVYDFVNGSNPNYCIGVGGSGLNAYIYNNTVYNCYYGITNGNATAIAKNNISYNNTVNYSGTFDAINSANNLSGPSQTDAPGSNPQQGKTVSFVNEIGKDFHLAPTDAGAKNYGADLSADTNLSFSDDIDGQSRPQGLAWDIGADEESSSWVTTPDFTLSSSKDIYATLSIPLPVFSSTSTETILDVIPLNEFSESVNLSISKIKNQDNEDVTNQFPSYIFSTDNIITKNEYTAIPKIGSAFKIGVNGSIPPGIYTITIEGKSSELIRTVTILLNMGYSGALWREI